jgi:hypothetical protein
MDKHRFQTTPPGDLPIFLKRLASVSARRASARRGRSGSIHEIRVILCGAISRGNNHFTPEPRAYLTDGT